MVHLSFARENVGRSQKNGQKGETDSQDRSQTTQPREEKFHRHWGETLYLFGAANKIANKDNALARI